MKVHVSNAERTDYDEVCLLSNLQRYKETKKKQNLIFHSLKWNIFLACIVHSPMYCHVERVFLFFFLNLLTRTACSASLSHDI